MIERRTSWLFRDVCCSLGRTSPCWYGQLTFQRCCTTKSSALPQGGFGLPIWDVWDFRKESACWPSPIITSTCCGLTLPQMCASDAWGKNPWALMKSCCKKPGLEVRTHLLPEPLLKGCHQRLYYEESFLQLQGYCLGVPRLRPDQLGGYVAYYHRTGDALPTMLEIQTGMSHRKVNGLELCPPSMMLANLLQIERDSIFTPPMHTLAALASVKEFWRSLQGYFKLAPASNGSLPELRAGAGNWLNVTSNSIRESFLRIDSQVRELASLANRRKKHGFNVNLVMPVCGDHDMEHLDTMERSVLQETRPLNDVIDLYIYDVCFRFCESAAYGPENDVEVELDLRTGSELPGSAFALRQLPESLLRLPTGEVAPNLHHVFRHYDDLPDFMMILHPDGYEHIEIFALVSVLNSLALRILRLGQGSALFSEDSFLERYTTRDPTGPYCQWVELAWELLFDRPPQLPEDDLWAHYDYGGYDFAQYIASRKAAQSRPKAFWQNAWRALCSASNYQLLLGTKFISWRELSSSEEARGADSFHKGLTTAFEHLYHVIFNPGAKTWLWPTRLRDPSLPLGLKFAMAGNPTLSSPLGFRVKEIQNFQLFLASCNMAVI
ncbi:unnamed protein product [Symbiodinium sp. CCMP2456]|nr:unnamed protein product [Symbiodinium sp. CCMP2456]